MNSEATCVAVFAAALAWLLIGTMVYRAVRRRAPEARDGVAGNCPAPAETMEWLLGRTDFELRLEAEFSRSARAASRGSVAVLRLDNFDEITSALGEPAGELALERLAWAVSSNGRAGDVIAEVGRGMCGVLMAKTPPDRADSHARRLRDASAGIYLLVGQADPVSFAVSVGVAHFPGHGESPGELIRAAERALDPGAPRPGP